MDAMYNWRLILAGCFLPLFFFFFRERSLRNVLFVDPTHRSGVLQTKHFSEISRGRRKRREEENSLQGYSRVLFALYCVKYYLPSDRRGRDGHLWVASPSLVYRVFHTMIPPIEAGCYKQNISQRCLAEEEKEDRKKTAYSRVLFALYCVKYYLPSDRRGRDGHLWVASPSLSVIGSGVAAVFL
jgi:hypothetical protein